MVNLELLEKKGITPESLKQKLSVDIFNTDNKELHNFRERTRSRIRNGIDDNLRKGPLYHALDLAWDLPFKQVSPTLLGTLLDKDADDEKVRSALSAYGFDLASVTCESVDEKTGKTIKKINAPAFFAVSVPLVKAYLTIRWAKIMNDRKLVPFLKYEPAIDNPITRTRCEALTSRVEVMSNQLGYFNSVKQAVFYMLHYGICLKFPMEEWFSEKQEAVKGEKFSVEEKENGNSRFVVYTKEGIRHHHPHPSRIFYDEAHKASTFNTDTGCEFGGFWKVLRYKDIRTNPSYYNKDKISVGDTSFWNNASLFFNTVYNCVIKIPEGLVTSAVSNDRESKIAENYYSSAMDDKSVLVTEYYEKLIPSENGLGDYDYPVWFRFVVAQYDTILYAAPVPYPPIIYYGYDADENRSQNAGLTLEILPFQDQFSNLLSQYLLGVKQNLTNVTFVDEAVVDKSWFDEFKNLGEKLWRKHNFFRFDSHKLKKSQNDHRQAFYSHKFPYLDTNAILQAMRTILEILERTLVMSSQEIAQAASHEQTREEVKNISQATSTRLTFTAHPVDDAREAMKRQIYMGLMAYGQDEFYAQIPFDPSIDKEKLRKLGFTWDDEDEDRDIDGNVKRVSVKTKKMAIQLLSFASNRDVNDRIDNVQAAVQMANGLAAWLANPILGPAIGPDQGITLVNMIARMAGFPREFKLQNKAPQMQQQAEAQQQELLGLLEQLKGSILKEVQEGLQPILDKENQLEARLASIEDILRSAPQTPDALLNDTGLVRTPYGSPTLQPPVMAPEAGMPVV